MCSLFGVLDYGRSLSNKKLSKMVSVLAKECEIRGTDATGVAYTFKNKLSIYKRPVPAHRLKFRVPHGCHTIMGHTRLTTQGSEKYNQNNHPFYGYTEDMPFALAHNGVLHNDKQLRLTEKLPKTNIQTDSYIAVQLIEKQNNLDFESLRYMAESVEGSFTFTVLDQTGNLLIVKGDSPMCVYHYPSLGFYIYASTEEILKRAVKKLSLQWQTHEKIGIECGDILKIDTVGDVEREQFTHEHIRPWQWGGRCYGYQYSVEDSALADDYWKELRFISGTFGYSPDDVDRYKRLGYPPDVVEEIFYCGDGQMENYMCI